MAWRSSGTNNTEMVDNLKRFGVITSPAVENGFRLVDRKFFVPKLLEDIAHVDQPLKQGNVHVSAPHIYGSALEALDLCHNSSLSFLNVGSGTGYFSSIVASIMGPKSTNFGVEIYQDVVQHSKQAIDMWKSSLADPSRIPPLQVFQGNALYVNHHRGEGSRGFDRIYIGASVERSDLSKLICLLKPGGVLVGPVDDELVKVVRIRKTEGEEASDDDFSQQFIAGVRFSPLLSSPISEVVIPAKVWEPDIHRFYPESFCEASKQLLLCSNAEYIQPPPANKRPDFRYNLAAILPKVIWMEILSFTHRDWFDPVQTEEQILRRRLLEEQEMSQKAEEGRVMAESHLYIAERERDFYRLRARRWQTRLQNMIRQQRGEHMNIASDSDEDSTFAIHSNGEDFAIHGLAAILRAFQGDRGPSEQEQMSDEMSFDDQTSQEQDFNDVVQYDFSSVEDEEPPREGVTRSRHVSIEVQNQTMLPNNARPLVLRPQLRTLSGSRDDV